MPLHADKLAGLQRQFRQRDATNRRPVAPIARPRPAYPRKPVVGVQPRPAPVKGNLDERRRQVAQRQRRQQTLQQAPHPRRVLERRQQRRAVAGRGVKLQQLEKEPREPGVPTLLQKLAYRMHQGRLSRHFADLQERRKEIGFRKV